MCKMLCYFQMLEQRREMYTEKNNKLLKMAAFFFFYIVSNTHFHFNSLYFITSLFSVAAWRTNDTDQLYRIFLKLPPYSLCRYMGSLKQ